jgi:hypothetical protein
MYKIGKLRKKSSEELHKLYTFHYKKFRYSKNTRIKKKAIITCNDIDIVSMSRIIIKNEKKLSSKTPFEEEMILRAKKIIGKGRLT